MSTALSASAKGASFLILVQVVSRALTFVLNQSLLRYIYPEILAAATQLELYSISILYFSRESIRVALQRQAGSPQAVVNFSWVCVAFGIPLSFAFAFAYSRWSLPDVLYITQALRLYGLASLLELLTEPCFAVVQQGLQYRVRAVAETSATIARGLVTFATIRWATSKGSEFGVLPFAIGQLAYAGVLILAYFAQTIPTSRSKQFSLLPNRVSSSIPTEYIFDLFSRPLCSLAANFYLQSGIKYVLTQGDSFLIVSLATLGEQGAYALASNYGSLVARMVFQPIEESSRNLFAQLCNAPSPESKEPPSSRNLDQARTLLHDILKFYYIISIVCFVVGPTLAPSLLQLVAGAKWSGHNAGDVLAAYCYYVPFLALNGVTEAFVAAVATNSELRQQSAMMGVYFVVFAASSYGFVGGMDLGAKGLIWASCLVMAIRTGRSIQSIKEFYGRHGKSFDIQTSLPSIWSIAVALGGVTALKATSDTGAQVGSASSLVSLLLRDGAIAAAFVATLLASERLFLRHCFDMLAPRSKKQ